jgi:hypothetical protein
VSENMVNFLDREAFFRLGFRDLVAALEPFRTTDLALLDPADRGTFHDWLLLVERFPERLVAACHELAEDELSRCLDLVDIIFRGAEMYGNPPVEVQDFFSGHRREETLYRRFNLSANLMRKLKPRPGFPYLDPMELMCDYLAALPVSLDEAKLKVRRKEDLDRSEIFALHDVAWLMIPLKLVDHLFPESAELDEYNAWKELWPELP